jgi:hypothetical protein
VADRVYWSFGVAGEVLLDCVLFSSSLGASWVTHCFFVLAYLCLFDFVVLAEFAFDGIYDS